MLEATDPKEMDKLGWKLHKLTTGHWSIWVNSNWWLTFSFDREYAEIVDYQDYR
jgi:proteic killer suppression protein